MVIQNMCFINTHKTAKMLVKMHVNKQLVNSKLINNKLKLLKFVHEISFPLPSIYYLNVIKESLMELWSIRSGLIS